MRNEDKGGSFLLQTPYDPEQMLNLRIVQRSGRLIEYEELCLKKERLGYFEQLFLAGRKLLNLHVRIHVYPKLGKQFLRLPDHAPLIHFSKPVYILFPKENILIYRKIVKQVQLLVNESDPGLLRIPDRRIFQFLTVKNHCPAVARVDSGQDIHKGRFAGPVLSKERVNLAFFHRKRYVLQHLYPVEGLADPAHFK